MEGCVHILAAKWNVACLLRSLEFYHVEREFFFRAGAIPELNSTLPRVDLEGKNTTMCRAS